MSMCKKKTIYVALLNDGTSVWRPVDATENSDSSYTIAVQHYDAEDEEWEYVPGNKVLCKSHTFSDGQAGLRAYSIA